MKMAVIGCGWAGRSHAVRGKELGLEVAGLCDIVEAFAQKLSDEVGSGFVTTDPERIMGNDNIDLVVIATQHDTHHPLAMRGAQTGKHLLVEKPICLTYAQANEVAEAVEKAGVKLVVNCKFRIAPTVQKVRELLPHPRMSHGQLAMDELRASGSTWVWDKEKGGGLVIGTAVHTIDLISFLMDSVPDRVYAEGQVFGEHKGTEGFPDGLVGTVLWKSGGLSTVISCDQGQNPYVSKWFCEVWDGERSAVLSAHISRVDFGGCDIETLETDAVSEEDQMKASMLANLVEAIETNGDTLCDARDAARTVALCNALDRAARTSKTQIVES